MQRHDLVYLDHATTAPLDPRARARMAALLEEDPRREGGLLADGRRARRIVEEARAEFARAIGARPDEVVFTSSGTEACNLALKGAALALRPPAGRILVAATEHSAVLCPARTLGKLGFEVVEVPVDGRALVDPEALEDRIRGGAALVSVALATPEVGTLQPVGAIARLARARGALLHVDACLAAAYAWVRVPDLEADLVSFSAHKMRGPRGTGALWVRPGVRLLPLIEGGVAEGGRRGGEPYVAGVAGFAAVASLAAAEASERGERLGRLAARLLEGATGVPGVALNGHPDLRLPGLVHLSVAGAEGEALLLGLARRGIAASSGSSCFQEAGKPSHVLLAMGQTAARARGSVLFSLGPDTTPEEIERTIEAFAATVSSLRAISPAGRT